MIYRTVTATFALCSLTLLASGQVQADVWIKDPITGCEVWSSAEDPNTENITWSGACIDGKASGLGVMTFYNKDGLLGIYKGQTKAGRLDGRGDLTFKNEKTGKFDNYIGRFTASNMNGMGKLTSSEGWTYEGEFKDGEEHGTGVYRLENGSVMRGEFADGKPVGSFLAGYVTKKGEEYFGDIENGKRHGEGMLILPDDTAYLGEFKQGVAEGPGLLDSADDSAYFGQFKAGKPNGFGTYIAPNGDVYQGMFKDGKGEGRILVTRKESGKQLVKIWKDGEEVK